MASILILNKVLNRFQPNLFIIAKTNESKLIGGISKFLIENYLLKMEFGFYTFVCGSVSYVLLNGSKSDVYIEKKIPAILGTLVNYVIYITSPAIAGFRTYRAIKSGNISIMQLK